jgi:phosphomannomutase/phosphoglucomutase
LWLTVLIALAGVIFGSLVLLRDLPKSLTEEVRQLLATAESKGRFRLRVPELQPLIALFGKMTPETRRQLVARVRLSAPQDPPEKSPAEAVAPTEGAEKASSETDEDDFPRHLFRTTDIYGHAEREFHDGLLERLAHAAALAFRKQGTQALIVARDGQAQSKRVATTMIKCLLSAGIDIIDLGEASRPVLAFATRAMPHDSGLLIGSRFDSDTHLSLQFIVKGAALTREHMTDIITAAASNVREHGDGRLIKHSATEDYLDKLTLDISIGAPLGVVLGGAQDHILAMAETVVTSLGCSVTRASDMTKKDLSESLSSIAGDVVNANADIGLWLSADGSELFAITDQGQVATADQLFLLFAEETLSRNPGGDVLFDTLGSRHIPSAVARLGGRASQVRPGSAFLEKAVADRSALLAGGFGGSFVIAERWYATADALYAAARLIELLSAQSKSFDRLLADLPSSAASPMWIIPMDIDARTRILRAVTAQSNFPNARVSHEGGLRLDYPDAWGAICELESQGAIAIRFEGASESAANSVKSTLSQALLTAEPGLSLPF